MANVIRRAVLGAIVGGALDVILVCLTVGTALYQKSTARLPGLFAAVVREDPHSLGFSFTINAFGLFLVVALGAAVAAFQSSHKQRHGSTPMPDSTPPTVRAR